MATAAAPTPMQIPREVARRYLLGKQGLWPGRRWRGKAGAAEAIRALGPVQMDPVALVARSHDLVLWSRVADYAPEHLTELLYQDRSFFDYGGHLDIYPIEELPYWHPHMVRRRGDERQTNFAAAHGALLDAVRSAVREHGPLGNRDLAGQSRVESYRGRKDSGVALYQLWLTGELMTHGRIGFERQYDLRERIAPPKLSWTATDAEAEAFFTVRGLATRSLFTARDWAAYLAYRLHRRADRPAAAAQLDQLHADGQIIALRIGGARGTYFAPASDQALLAELSAEKVPPAWRSHRKTTEDEVIFLSPLDNLLDRQRTKQFFNFEILWEIYKPAAKRRWGAYTMPILYGDQLVGRIDPKLDRASTTLILNGIWLEEPYLADNSAFAVAFAAGLANFAQFHAAQSITLPADTPAILRAAVAAIRPE